MLLPDRRALFKIDIFHIHFAIGIYRNQRNSEKFRALTVTRFSSGTWLLGGTVKDGKSIGEKEFELVSRHLWWERQRQW